MGMAEWTLEEAAADLQVAKAKLQTLPRRMRSRRRTRRPPPLVAFKALRSSAVADGLALPPSLNDGCNPIGGACLSTPCETHIELLPQAGRAQLLPCLAAPQLYPQPVQKNPGLQFHFPTMHQELSAFPSAPQVKIEPAFMDQTRLTASASPKPLWGYPP